MYDSKANHSPRFALFDAPSILGNLMIPAIFAIIFSISFIVQSMKHPYILFFFLQESVSVFHDDDIIQLLVSRMANQQMSNDKKNLVGCII